MYKYGDRILKIRFVNSWLPKQLVIEKVLPDICLQAKYLPAANQIWLQCFPMGTTLSCYWLFPAVTAPSCYWLFTADTAPSCYWLFPDDTAPSCYWLFPAGTAPSWYWLFPNWHNSLYSGGWADPSQEGASPSILLDGQIQCRKGSLPLYWRVGRSSAGRGHSHYIGGWADPVQEGVTLYIGGWADPVQDWVSLFHIYWRVGRSSAERDLSLFHVYWRVGRSSAGRVSLYFMYIGG